MSVDNVCVTLTSSPTVPARFRELASEVGSALAHRGHGLIYGGTAFGMMLDIATAYKEAGGHRLVGVMAQTLITTMPNYRQFDKLDEALVVPTTAERKNTMMELADGFVALPGGYGTLEELSQIVAGKEQKQHVKPVGILNLDRHYDHLLDQWQAFSDHGFTRAGVGELVFVADNIEAILDNFSQYRPAELADRFV